MSFVLSRPIHPGEILREEYLVPLQISPGQLANALNLPRTRIERIVKEKVGISIDTALRLGRYLGSSPEFWLNLQRAYDLQVEGSAKRDELLRIEPRETKAA